MKKLFRVNPYDNFDSSGFKLDIQGWGSNRRIFRKLISELNPKLIIEVGSWKGASAINMGKCIKEKKINCKILCVDTWLGGLDHWISKEKNQDCWYDSLMMKNGYPQLYYQFLYNVLYNKLRDIIVPFPNTSFIASKFLKKQEIKADLIYIDGSHEEPDVYSDLVNYYKLLNKNGVIFGDDFKWTGVKAAVTKFVGENNLNLELVEEDAVWLLYKNK